MKLEVTILLDSWNKDKVIHKLFHQFPVIILDYGDECLKSWLLKLYSILSISTFTAETARILSV